MRPRLTPSAKDYWKPAIGNGELYSKQLYLFFRHTLHHALFYKWCISHMAKIRLQLKRRPQNWNRALPCEMCCECKADNDADYLCTRIQKLLRAHLEESGWVDDLKDLAKGEKKDKRRKIIN